MAKASPPLNGTAAAAAAAAPPDRREVAEKKSKKSDILDVSTFRTFSHVFGRFRPLPSVLDSFSKTRSQYSREPVFQSPH